MPLYYFLRNQVAVPPVNTPKANVPTTFKIFVFLSDIINLLSPARCLAFISPAK